MNSYTSLKDIRITKSLLGWGILAGPVYVVTGAAEMVTREGFDPLRHSLSLMSNGAFGWVHTTMMILTGLFTITAAVGFYRSRYLGVGTGWAPCLLGLYGLGLVGAGIFTADPALGFPTGTPADANDISWHGLLHFVCGGIGFLGLIGACFSFARAFGRMGEKSWSLLSAVTSMVFLAGFAGIASGQGSPVVHRGGRAGLGMDDGGVAQDVSPAWRCMCAGRSVDPLIEETGGRALRCRKECRSVVFGRQSNESRRKSNEKDRDRRKHLVGRRDPFTRRTGRGPCGVIEPWLAGRES